MTSDQRFANSGFTMIEVLVALVVIAVLLTAMGSLIAVSTRSTRSFGLYPGMLQAGRMVMASVADADRLYLGPMSGEVNGHRWQLDVLAFDSMGLGPLQPISWRPQTLIITVKSSMGTVLRLETVRLQRRDGE